MDNCKINLLLNKIAGYEIGLIPKIKCFLYPRKNEYKFHIEQIVKYIYYEMSYHDHIDDYHNYMKNNSYCECYYNRKHRKLNELKKHKCVKIMKIINHGYDENKFQRTYKCGFGYQFKLECHKTEEELTDICL